MKDIDISEVIDFVCDLIDRGEVNNVEEGMDVFREELKGMEVDMGIIEKCLKEEFVEGFSENWELV
jgi:hypothetical protein